MDGISHEELLAIGTRRGAPLVPAGMSASDINAPIPHIAAQAAIAGMEGYSDDILRSVGEHKIPMPAIQPSHINAPKVEADMSSIESTLLKLQSFLGIRTK